MICSRSETVLSELLWLHLVRHMYDRLSPVELGVGAFANIYQGLPATLDTEVVPLTAPDSEDGLFEVPDNDDVFDAGQVYRVVYNAQ